MTQDEPERVNPCAKIFDHKWLDPNCVENGCQSLVLQSLLTVSEKRADANERERIHVETLLHAAWAEHRTSMEQLIAAHASLTAIQSERDSLRSSLMRVSEAAIKQLAVLEQHTHPLELGTGAVIREIRSALQASGDG